MRPFLVHYIISSVLLTAIKLKGWKPWLENGEICGKGVSTKKKKKEEGH